MSSICRVGIGMLYKNHSSSNTIYDASSRCWQSIANLCGLVCRRVVWLPWVPGIHDAKLHGLHVIFVNFCRPQMRQHNQCMYFCELCIMMYMSSRGQAVYIFCRLPDLEGKTWGWGWKRHVLFYLYVSEYVVGLSLFFLVFLRLSCFLRFANLYFLNGALLGSLGSLRVRFHCGIHFRDLVRTEKLRKS